MRGVLKRRFLLHIAYVLLWLLPYSENIAQDDAFQPIYDGLPVDDLFWTADSQQLMFRHLEAGQGFVEAAWSVYTIRSRTAIRVTELPSQVTLSSAMHDRYSLDNPFEILAFSSPDGNYVVTGRFTGAHEAARRWETVIVDTLQDRVIHTAIPALGVTTTPHYFNVTWNADSQVLILATSALRVSEPSFFYWVSGYADSANQPDVREITRFSIDDRQYTTRRIYDVSSDGHAILLHGVHHTPEPNTRQTFFPLIVWKADGNHQVLLNDFDKRPGAFNLLTASFVPDNEDALLIVDERGLLHYTPDTGESTILRSDITSVRFREAHFSPDGTFLALVENVAELREIVYIIEVRSNI